MKAHRELNLKKLVPSVSASLELCDEHAAELRLREALEAGRREPSGETLGRGPGRERGFSRAGQSRVPRWVWVVGLALLVALVVVLAFGWARRRGPSLVVPGAGRAGDRGTTVLLASRGVDSTMEGVLGVGEQPSFGTTFIRGAACAPCRSD
jgi:hypothetical protein